ncbi:MAG: alpha/beta fold hydrolase [Actinomycetales bacterium]
MLDHITLESGARLDFFVEGEGDALLVYHHGTPAAGPIPREISGPAAAHDMVVAEVVRPGYGNSTREPGRSVADVVPLTAAIADHLGHERFVTVGWSSGGPHAIACAALLADRCMAAMTLAGNAPFDADGLDPLAGMDEVGIAEFSAALGDPAALENILSQASVEQRQVTVAKLLEVGRSHLPPADQAHLTPEIAEVIASQLRWSLANGFWGWFDDDIAVTRPWGFDLRSIARPVLLWQGTHDGMIPFAHGQLLADVIPGSMANFVEGEGHLSIGGVACDPGFAELRRALST